MKDGARDTAHENAVMDHARAVVFSIADGALPSNEGRGYVIRKLIRLGCDHLGKAGAARTGTFHKLAPIVVRVMKDVYPELADKEKTILAVMENEEKAYLEVLATQIPKLEQEIAAAKKKTTHADAAATKVNTAALAFKYYDTYGLPLENIVQHLERAHLPFGGELFNNHLEEQQKRSREASKIGGEIFTKKGAYGLADDIARTEFTGYHGTEAEGMLLRVIKNNEKAKFLQTGEEGLLIFNRTPCYAEAGGQIGDTGEITSRDFKAVVLDTQYLEKAIAHKVKVEKGEAREGADFHLKVDAGRRADIMKNHTATHLLHSALRRVLGEHVKQSGSLVAPDRLRFDFTHFKALTAEELAKVEELVNAEIKKNTSLEKRVLPKDEAIKEGAIAFFGEKYEDEVRVVTIGEFSKELCGGTHLHSTGEIESFKIVSEGSIQAGVRRLEAVTGKKALMAVEERERELDSLASAFKAGRESLPQDLMKLDQRLSSLKNKMTNLVGLKVRSKISDDFGKSQEIQGVRLLVENMDGADAELLQSAADHLKSLNQPFAALLSSQSGEKVSFAVAGSAQLAQTGFHSGKIVKNVAAVVGGSGGGRPDFAVGGGKNLAKRKEAMDLGLKEISAFLKGGKG